MLAHHLLFSLGYSAASADLLHDAALKGFVLAHEGRWEASAAAFSQGRGNAYNRGIALARSAHYRDAIDAFDDVLEESPEDADAQFNKDVVRKILADGAVDAGRAKGMANATANKEHRGKASDIGDGEASSGEYKKVMEQPLMGGDDADGDDDIGDGVQLMRK